LIINYTHTNKERNTAKKYMGKEGRKIREENTQVEKRREKENMERESKRNGTTQRKRQEMYV
jgi:hypothetical protein